MFIFVFLQGFVKWLPPRRLKKMAAYAPREIVYFNDPKS
jgi:hypothetical protein